MVRDWDTIRNILEKIEDETLFDFLKEVETDVRFKKTEKRFRYELIEHLRLLVEAGYIQGVKVHSATPEKVEYSISTPSMTMEGYDLLEVLRSKTVWASVKDRLKAAGIGITAEAVKIALQSALKQAL